MHSLVRAVRRIAVLALATQWLMAAGEPFTISGGVTDAANGHPLQGVQVFIPGTAVGTLTNAEGRYVLLFPEGLTVPRELQVVAQLIGYDSGIARLGLSGRPAQASATADFQLDMTIIALDEIVVTGKAGELVRRPLAAVVSDATTAAPANQPAHPRGWTNLQPPASSAATPRVPRVTPTTPPTGAARWGSTTSSAGHRDPQPFDREQYAHISESGFLSAADNPLSTFSIDVDRASYSNIRRFLLHEGRLPPVDAVQVEEMVNYFPYEYELPHRGEAPIAVTTELGEAPWSEGRQLLRVGLASMPIDMSDAPPNNLVFLLDVSGSMQSPDKLPLVKRSLRLLVDQLREQDRVAIVVYAGAAGLVLEPTSGARRHLVLEAIERLEAGGSTAGGAGLRLAYDVAQRHFTRGGNNRVILATDGDFNVGESSDAAMVGLVEDRRREGTFLTVLGFGTGNLQSSKMQEMAQHGNGNYAYIDGLDEARKVLVHEMGGTLLTVAKDVKIQVEFNPARVHSYRLIGYENRMLAAQDFNDDRKDAGELGAGHTVTALYEVVPTGSVSDSGGATIDPLRYQASLGPVPRRTDHGELAFVKVRYKDPDGRESRLITKPVQANAVRSASPDLRFASAVAGFGMLLRESEYRGTLSVEEVLSLAHSGLGEDLEGYRHGFVELVRTYEQLTGHLHADGGSR